MKRVVSLVMVLMLCFSLTAFADEYDFLSKPINSYEAGISVTMSVNEPMTVLNLISRAAGMDSVVNLQLLAEGLCNSTNTGVVKLNSNSDYTKMQLSYEIYSVVPANINRNFKLSAEMAYGMWLKWDITDELNPVIEYITQQPMSDKYMSVNLVELMENQGISLPDYVSSIKKFFNEENMRTIGDKTADILRKNSSLKTSGSKVTINVTADQMVTLVSQIIEFIIDEYDDNEEFDLLYEGKTGYLSDILPTTEQIKEFFDDIKLFDENALVMEYIKTPAGVLKSSTVSVNFDIDLDYILKEMDIKPLANESKNIKFSINAKSDYSKVNQNVKVEFPALTPENSTTMQEYIDSFNTYEYEWNGENCYHDEYVHTYSDYVPAKDNNFYVSLPKLTESLKNYGYSYAIVRTDNDIVLTEDSGKEYFNKVQMTIGSNDIYIDGVQYTASVPTALSASQIYVACDGIEAIFNLNMQYASVYLDSNNQTCSFERRSPQCHHTDEEIYNYDYEYCEHYQNLYLASQYPYDGTGYIKLRDVIDRMYNYSGGCDISYDSGTVTITDPVASQGFSEIKITAGSNEYLVDGSLITCGSPAVEYFDSMYIDDYAAVGIFGFELGSPTLEFRKNYSEDGTYLGMISEYNIELWRKSPGCPHTDEEIE